MNYTELKDQVLNILPQKCELGEADNLLQKGLNSLKIMRIASQWRKQGIKVPFGTLMETPTLGAWWELIQKQVSGSAEKGTLRQPEQAEEKQEALQYNTPFALTDVQYAYWIGRGEEQTLGNIGCHAYLEFDGTGVEPERLQDAWNVLQYHHPMLRARFLDNGMQEIMEQPYSETIEVCAYQNKTPEQVQVLLEEKRAERSHRKLRIEEGEVAGICLCLLPEGRSRILFDVDLLVADVQSLQILLRHLSMAYRGEPLPESGKNWDFAAYLKKQENTDQEERQKAKEYWHSRLETLPVGPDLPLAKRPEEVKETRFRRRICNLTTVQWEVLQKKAAEYQVTPASMLLAAYVTILARWSTNQKFLINIPLFNRKTEVEGIEQVVADFTTLLLLEADCTGNLTFVELVRRLQKQMHQDMEYGKYSGVQVQRDLTQYYEEQMNVAPVVFACNLGNPLVDQQFVDTLGKFSYMISQTPQVWMDFQSYEDENGLMLTWDTVDELFPAHMMDEMMESFDRLMKNLAETSWEQIFDVLPQKQQEWIAAQAQVGDLEAPACLHEAFLKWTVQTPDAVALVDTGLGLSFTYGELGDRVQAVAAALMKQGIQKEPIAITLPRGYAQIEAALAILVSGNFYVPVSIEQPEERRKMIHEKTGIRYVITEKQISQGIVWPEHVEQFYLEQMEQESATVSYPQVSPDDTAYIIMTSGTTGLPKGVEIAHKGAWNTIQDINEKYGIGPTDTALAISAMDFDLSVYDVFGILGAGGRLVLVPDEEKRNAAYWLEQVKTYQVTVWNSVPVLMEMLLVSAEAKCETLPLRVVMLSGDWIGMNLPERIKAWTENCTIVAMGGATEASIWSNFQEVTLPLPTEWKSIPYGAPLRGQAYRVVDASGKDCPCFVEGELWIGGHGVAKGYRGDPELTREKFVEDALGRWYRTGDNGRFWADGTIEFLGRKDNQVKVRGHRIEIGEIESALRQCDGIGHVIVDVIGEPNGEKYLAAFIEAERKEETSITEKLHGDGKLDAFWNAVSGQSLPADANIQRAYETFFHTANQACVNAIETVWTTLGLPVPDQNFNSNLEEVLKAASIQPEWEPLVVRWQKILAESQAGKIEQSARYEDLYRYLDEITEKLPDILTGQAEPLEVYYDRETHLTPNDLLTQIPGNEVFIEALCQAVGCLGASGKKCVRILEIGTRDGAVSRRIQEALQRQGTEVAYCYGDTSQYFINLAKEALQAYDRITYQIIDFEKETWEGELEEDSYDLVIAYHSLHRTAHVETLLHQVNGILAPGGILYVQELTQYSYLQEVSAAVLEHGFVGMQDERKEKQSGILDRDTWKKLVKETGFAQSVFHSDCYGRTVFWVRQREEKLVFTSAHIRETIAKKLPEYMIPKVYRFMEQFPTSKNGKIDRTALKKMVSVDQENGNKSMAETETEEKLLQIWKTLFGTEQMGVTDNYFSMGGDSLVATRLIAEVQKRFGCKLSIGKIFEKPTVRELAKEIEGTESHKEDLPQVTPKPEEAALPFPLTDVQYAYWIGRNGLYDLGNVATHCYFELDTEQISVKQAQEALNCLIRKHGMMRVVIQEDGQQKILPQVPEYEIAVTDISMCTPEEQETQLGLQRDAMSHEVIDTSKWPLFAVRMTKCSERTARIHISFDNIIFDGWSMFHILNEWAEAYRGTLKEEELNFSFRDYVLGMEAVKQTDRYAEDERYWKERVEEFLPAPALPLAKREGDVKDQKFHRRTARLSHREWTRLKALGSDMGVTPSALLLTAYAETLRLWSTNEEFTINLTQFQRTPFHPQVNQLVGDFTTLTLLEIHQKNNSSFADRCRAVQQQLAKDMEHSFYSAIEVERELKKQSGTQKGSIMPIVFTSGLGIEQWNDGKWLGKLVYNISQTPQVWLDHQVVEMDGALCLFWDAVEELFHPGMLDEMFAGYVHLLQELAADDTLAYEMRNSLITAVIGEERTAANDTAQPIREDTLDGMFWKMYQRNPEKEALVGVDRRLTYREVAEEAAFLCEQIQNSGVKKGDTVGIVMEKSWEQVVAAYGILLAGAAYLPIDVHNPEERIRTILTDSQTKLLLTKQTVLEEKSWLQEWTCIPVQGQKAKLPLTAGESKPQDLAYVIYTSGTTGTPKGVMITHHGAVNTIQTINEAYQVGPEDKAFGISNLHFDLSVYDVFGLLGAGGTLVIPDYRKVREPAYWLEMIAREGITIWNSVPAFMEMLAEYQEHQKTGQTAYDTLRLVMMSGDWIPLTLPDRLRKIVPHARLISLGGATEASIWSNQYEIPETIPADWKSIPYGTPLANQRFYVLNANLENCPAWVPGMLYIAGEGLAEGYLNDAKRTAEKFFCHPQTKERLYCTGDMGCYWPDGTIEFLGRQDHQVKINGYRVELGEIESALRKIAGVKDAIVVTSKRPAGMELTAVLLTETKQETEAYQKVLGKRIPRYMIPKHFVTTDAFVLTANGKVNRAYYQNRIDDLVSEEKEMPETEHTTEMLSDMQKQMIAIWERVLGTSVALEDNFFELGGNSLQAIRIINEMSECFHTQIEVGDLFEYPTVQELEQQITGQGE